jgi:hypothetical protein
MREGDRTLIFARRFQRLAEIRPRQQQVKPAKGEDRNEDDA